MTLEDDTVAILKLGRFSFILSKQYNQEAAENQMLQLMVRNLDLWWERVTAAELEQKFGVRPPRPPAMQAWDLKVGFLFDTAAFWDMLRTRCFKEATRSFRALAKQARL